MATGFSFPTPKNQFDALRRDGSRPTTPPMGNLFQRPGTPPVHTPPPVTNPPGGMHQDHDGKRDDHWGNQRDNKDNHGNNRRTPPGRPPKPNCRWVCGDDHHDGPRPPVPIGHPHVTPPGIIGGVPAMDKPIVPPPIPPGPAASTGGYPSCREVNTSAGVAMQCDDTLNECEKVCLRDFNAKMINSPGDEQTTRASWNKCMTTCRNTGGNVSSSIEPDKPEPMRVRYTN